MPYDVRTSEEPHFALLVLLSDAVGLFRQSRPVRSHIAGWYRLGGQGLEISCWEWNMGGLGDRQFVHTGWFESLRYYV